MFVSHLHKIVEKSITIFDESVTQVLFEGVRLCVLYSGANHNQYWYEKAV